MEIKICPQCHGSGLTGQQIGKEFVKCPACQGSGYPSGYTPPSHEEVRQYMIKMANEPIAKP